MKSVFQIIIIPFVTLLYFITEGITNIPYLVLSFVNSSICCYLMFDKPQRPFTLSKIISIFCFIFFIVANGIQFARNSFLLTFSYYFNNIDYIIFQAILLFILFVYTITYTRYFQFFNRKLTRTQECLKIDTINYKLLFFIASIATIVIILNHTHDISSLFIRGTFDNIAYSEEPDDKSSLLIQSKVIRPLPFASLMIALIYKAPPKITIPLFIFTLITNFPTGLARNSSASIWIPIFLLLFKNKLKHNAFMWLMILAIFVVFPFLNIFRRWDGSMDFSWSIDFLDRIDFDASQIFMATVYTGFITWGKQLIGVLFFWFPRRYWPDKPVGSGHLLVNEHHGWFDNVSMPFFSEGYVNFGFVGIFVFTILLAWFSAKLDSLYWSKWSKHPNLKSGFYLILIGSLIFIMRGDLMSSTAFTVGVMISYSICLLLCTSYHFTKLQFR